MMRWIDSKDLEMWAERRDCQEYLPLVIRRLIRASVNNIKSISFPAGESIIYPGWDGRLESIEETEYVPKGLSVWEIGTNKNIRKKAEDDYEKRRQNLLGINPSEMVFIFVTPRIWTAKESWAGEKRNEKFWRDVKVFDARVLEEWLEQTPAVGAWLGKHIGKYQGNIISLENWWEEWSQVTRPPISPELVLGGRIEESTKVIEWLKGDPTSLLVQALTKDESIAFLFTVILSLPENEKEYFLSRSIVVQDQNSFRRIVTTNKNGLIIIPTFEEIDIVVPYSNLHHIFIPLSPDITASREKIVLPFIKREEFNSCLEKMGITKEDAEKHSRDTARCLSVLRRQLSHVSKQPEWAKSENVKELLPALLIGKWDESKEGDKEIISELAGTSYDEYVVSLKKWLYQFDPPIIKIGEIWRLLSFLDAFFILSPFLSSSHFGKFKNISLKVLSEIDPALELEPDKRWMASVYGKTPKYSRELREGIAQTLILIAVFGDKVNSGRGLDLPSGYHTSQVFVDNIVKELLNNADWRLWCSLSDVLPLIAEASPSSFLDAVENSLSKNPPPIMGMFSETDDTFTSHSAHPSLLWALERLAWDPSLLGRVTLILGKLARLDPGGKLANRPINSLRAIFLLWLPQTFADLELRLKALDLLIEREPKIAWNLLINLLSHAHDIVFPNPKSRWRQFSEKTENKVTNKEYFESIVGIVERVLNNVNHDGVKWCQVMEHFSNLPPSERQKVLNKLSGCIDLIEEGNFELWNKLREILSRHRSFSDTEWALPEQELIKIEDLYNKLEPQDLIMQYQWLFDDYRPELPEGKELKNYEKFEYIVSLKRKDAIQSLKNTLGINGIIELANQTKNPHFVGLTLAEITLSGEEEEILFSLFDSDNQKQISFVQAYLWQKSSKIGDTYIEKVINKAKSENWSSEKVVNLFLGLPQKRTVWNLLKNFDEEVEQKYWEKVDPRFFDIPINDKLYGLQKLIEVKRLFITLDIAALFKKEIPAKFIVEMLRKAASEKSIDSVNIIHRWDIEELFKVLDEAEGVSSDEIAQLEWLYLSILANVGSSRPPKMLHQELSNNPESFAEVLRWIYKPKNKDIDEEEEELPEELKQQRAHQAWKLLHTWKTIPGSDDSGKIDYQKLKKWTDKAREICKKMDRIEVCDSHIGQVFAHALPDDNGSWPPEAICKIVEEIGSKELDDGFITGIFNKRGVVSKSPFEGGKQERELAKQYMEYSQKLAIQYQRTRSILKKVTEGYENQAKQEDKEAEKRDLEW